MKNNSYNKFISFVSFIQSNNKLVPELYTNLLKKMEGVSEEVKNNMCNAIAFIDAPMREIIGLNNKICPQYSGSTNKKYMILKARIVLGESPTDVLPGLTSKEAHDALMLGFHNASEYILRDITISSNKDRFSVKVARWIVGCFNDSERRAALLLERSERVAGAEIRGRFIDRVEELCDSDLINGMGTGVRVAFEECSKRFYAEWEKTAENSHEALNSIPHWWVPASYAKILMSAHDLMVEGRAMHHCVGTYASAVQSGAVIIVSICFFDEENNLHRSTVELDRKTKKVLQHRGDSNKEPSELCKEKVKDLLKMVSKKQSVSLER